MVDFFEKTMIYLCREEKHNFLKNCLEYSKYGKIMKINGKGVIWKR